MELKLYIRVQKEKEAGKVSLSRTVEIVKSGWEIVFSCVQCRTMEGGVGFAPSQSSRSLQPSLNSKAFVQVEHRVNRSTWVLLHRAVTGSKGDILNVSL